ncbi:DNA polymerase IV [Pedobacter sp. HMF7647]|uniref:DNA polymerase IV n=1 Tax=Hufsiella arboris TaxID=2695275 RepID=A0A7K1Y9L3_9SPHI|nr:DNA polymerase IV [Hufsiella arboris]MXV51277.1 DNA polymerase IV [Hufsiella arboris]
MKRYIVHIDLDSFFVSVERLKDPSLRGKPVLIGGSGDRGVVASCSYEARKFGIHSAMPMRTARRLCPDAITLRGDYHAYSDASASVTSIIHSMVPLYEKTSIDEFYIDLTGMDQFFGCYKLATELRRQVIKQTGLPISFGLASNKTVAKLATNQAKPNGQLFVEHGKEREFLAPLPVGSIPMIGDKACETLRGMGIHRVKDLQEQKIENLERVFGKMGQMMWDKANGIDHSEIVPHHGRKSISSENTFSQNVMDEPKLEELLISMTEQLAAKLRIERKVASCIAVKIRYSDFETNTQQLSMPATNSDHLLFPLIKKLFRKAYQQGRKIRLVGVRLSNLAEGPFQPGLFDDFERSSKLYKALDQLNVRYGSKTISRALTMGISSRDFNPFNGKTG